MHDGRTDRIWKYTYVLPEDCLKVISVIAPDKLAEYNNFDCDCMNNSSYSDTVELTDYEATLLAGVPNAPSVYSPKVNLNLAERRQDVVLNKMVDAGYLTTTEMKEIQAEQLTK